MRIGCLGYANMANSRTGPAGRVNYQLYGVFIVPRSRKLQSSKLHRRHVAEADSINSLIL